MVFRNFRFIVIFRILLLTATIFLFFYTLTLDYFVTPFLIALVIVFQIYMLFKFLDKTNRDLSSFLESIRFSEFTRSFRIEGMGSSFDELNKAFNDVIQDFQKVRSEKEEQYQYLQSLVKHIDVSIITYQRNGTVDMVNNAFKKLFQLNSLKNINELNEKSPDLVKSLLKIEPGKNCLIKIQEEDDILQLAISGTEFKIHDKTIILVTIKDIQNVLEEHETETWQKLIRVLTHEIMNSITPISSLTSTLDIMLINAISNHKTLDEESLSEISQAIKTIHKRSNGLLHFVNTYRNLTKIPKPSFKIEHIKEIFNGILPLIKEEINKSKVKISFSVEPELLEIHADIKLIEQVIINLITNAIHATENQANGEIHVRAFLNKRERVSIQVIDNGQGILKDVIDKIFIPFFTTKPKGSGIGLSLSKQIMRLHGGSITASSEPDKGSVFTLTF
ncbi:MAG: histidine kinase [Bacteroidetes bacterium GWC2_33_15]|nr:MAG: histidine kinase [Bacteroidetes bacterium GWA2_33_15]OFX48801.1 MAG: histidine kinase [Bacteroidetes bacterium GWC2_33_15]OFX66043.1 MAG: histidine kinase [Bacteroidetes bacterium GWB2_32_14]OFX68195.1 MAG: histidine kinase [Bacteroidetes bacterium GWD2_33_33]HAN17970.1 ATP-binding protein [Bacteroidales bacterium]